MRNTLWEDILKLSLAATVIALACPDVALAQELQQSVSEVKTGMQMMPTVLSGVAYLGGGATMMHGAGLLKKHADGPTQVPLAQGLMRMGVGAAIAALPILMGWVGDSLKTRDANQLDFVSMSEIQ
jgi:hypothetical protein